MHDAVCVTCLVISSFFPHPQCGSTPPDSDTDLMVAGAPAGEDCRLCRFDGDDLQVWLLFAQEPAHARDGAPRTDRSHQDVHLPTRVSPDLRPRLTVVHLGGGAMSIA